MAIINSVIKGKQPVIDTLNVTPTTSAQQITAPSGTDGYSPVNVSAVTSSIDANIVAGNIKKDVQILGVTGSYEGTTPTGTVNITSNGTHNVSSYEYAEVLVPTSAPAYYIEKTKDANGVAGNSSHLMDFSTFTDVGNYVFAYAYYGNTGITGTVDLSSLTILSGLNSCQYMFNGCVYITSVDLSGLTTVNSNYACQYMFGSCTGLASVDLSSLSAVASQHSCFNMFSGTSVASVDLPSLKTISGLNSCQYMFNSCTSLTSANLGSLILVSGGSACSNMFSGCANLANINLNSLTWISGTQAFDSMFWGTKLTSVDMPHLTKLGTANQLSSTFRNCTSLTDLKFSGLAYTTVNINAAFANTLQGVTGCTVHFPSDWQTAMASYSNITNGLGGTNTTVLFDLPAVTSFDFSYMGATTLTAFSNFNNGGIFPNVTSVDFGSINTITACQNMFQGCTAITSITLGSLTNASGNNCCSAMFKGCTGIIGNVDLSMLTIVDGQQACYNMFTNCTGLTSVNLSSLKSVTGISNACGLMFANDTSITSLSFPALKTVTSNAMFNNIVNGITGCTIHFPSNMSSYNFASAVGGTNTTVLYDLPATNILTGADTKEYERNPKYDTATALAWRINGTMPNTTTYYTSGLTDPTVGTTIYSDSACTIAETTVDSIS